MDAILSEATEPGRRLGDLHARLSDLLLALDGAELHGAAAYVSMALDRMQRDYPELSGNR